MNEDNNQFYKILLR